MTQPIRLKRLDYSSEKAAGRFSYWPDSGRYEMELFGDWHDAMSGCQGVADEVTIGIRTRRSVFAAFFSLGGRLHLQLDGKHFEWPRDDVNVTLDRRWLVTREFRVWRRGELEYGCSYWSFDPESYPGGLRMDIFSTIKNSVATPRAVAAFLHRWEANASGVDTTSPEYQRQLKTHLDALDGN